MNSPQLPAFQTGIQQDFRSPLTRRSTGWKILGSSCGWKAELLESLSAAGDRRCCECSNGVCFSAESSSQQPSSLVVFLLSCMKSLLLKAEKAEMLTSSVSLPCECWAGAQTVSSWPGSGHPSSCLWHQPASAGNSFSLSSTTALKGCARYNR